MVKNVKKTEKVLFQEKTEGKLNLVLIEAWSKELEEDHFTGEPLNDWRTAGGEYSYCVVITFSKMSSSVIQLHSAGRWAENPVIDKLQLL